MLSLRQLLQTSNFIMKEVLRNKIAVVWPPLLFRRVASATLSRCFFIWKTEGHEGLFLGGWSNKPLVGDWLSGLLWKMKLEGYKCLIWGVPWQITSYSWREVTIATAFMKWKLRKEGLSWDLHLDWLCFSCEIMSTFVLIILLLTCSFLYVQGVQLRVVICSIFRTYADHQKRTTSERGICIKCKKGSSKTTKHKSKKNMLLL